MTNKEIIEKSEIKENILFLPDIQLDRKAYLNLKKEIEFLGGKWKTNKKGFVFDRVVTIESLLENKETKKDLQFFATPKEISERLIYLADLKKNQTVLEPSAGRGAIVEEIIKKTNTTVDCYEISEVNREYLSMYNINLLGNDFLESDEKKYSRIIANPPFSKNQDIDHIKRMYGKLKDGGKLVSVASLHWKMSTNKKETEFREFLNLVKAEVIELEENDFKESGTKIKACIITITK